MLEKYKLTIKEMEDLNIKLINSDKKSADYETLIENLKIEMETNKSNLIRTEEKCSIRNQEIIELNCKMKGMESLIQNYDLQISELKESQNK